MKRKGMIYVLGALVLVVWGAIIYRIVAAVATDDDVLPAAIAVNTEKVYDDYAPKPDTTKLALNYRDPFGMVSNVKDSAVIVPVRAISKPAISVTQAPLNWSFIKYSGFIRNPDSKKLIAILTINGKNVMLNEGETDSEVKLLKNLKDSVKVSFKGRTKFIPIDHQAL